MEPGGLCPQPKRDPSSGLPAPPYDISFDEPGVSSVFKRLYEPYCELQILFERARGEELLKTFEAHQDETRLRGKRGVAAASGEEAAAVAMPATAGDDTLDAALARALPLPLLLRVCNKLLRVPFANERQLLAALRRPSVDAPPDAAFFRIAIRRAEVAGRSAAGRVLCSAAHRCALALLRGDSLVAPHYRLGVGVNHAMATLPYLAGLLHDLWERGGRGALRAQHGGSHSTAGEAEAMELLQSWEASTGADADGLVDYQLGVIYLEVHCGLLVLGDRIFRRDYERRSLEEVSLHELGSFGC